MNKPMKKSKTETKTIHYDLQEIVDPLFRLGIFGLYWFLTQGSKSDRYPMAQRTATFWWETDHLYTLTLHYEDAVKDLDPLLDNIGGDFREGVAIPPGYETNPDSPGFYLTVLAHRALTNSIFAPGGANSKVRGRSLNSYTVPGTKTKLRKALEENGVDMTRFLTKVDSLSRTVYKDKSETQEPIEWTFTPWFHPQTIEHGGTTVKLRTPLEAKSLGQIIHPSYVKWNNMEVSRFSGRISKEEKLKEVFPLYFACLAYVYTSTSEFTTVGVGLDMDDFASFSKSMKRHLRNGPEYTGLGFYARIYGDSTKLAAFALLSFLDAPSDRTYNVVSGTKDDVFSLFYHYDVSVSRHPMYDRFRQALTTLSDTPSEYIDTKGLLRGLRFHPVLERPGGKVKLKVSLYDRMFENIETGAPWYRGFSDLITVSSRSPWLYSKLMTLLGGPVEQLVFDDIRSCLSARVRQSHYKGKEAWDRAREDLENILRAASRHDFHSVRTAMARIAELCGRGFRPETMTAIFKEKDPGVKDLLVLGIYASQGTKKVSSSEEGEQPPSNGGGVDGVVSGNNSDNVVRE